MSKRDHLSQMAYEASQLGMTYGKYIAKYHPRNSYGEGLTDLPEPVLRKRKRGRAFFATNQKTGEVRYYRSMQEAEADGFFQSSVDNCLSGAYRQHHGWTFRLATPEEMENHKEEPHDSV